MEKAAQKKEYRWDAFVADPHDPNDYPPVADFDQRFFYGDSYQLIADHRYETALGSCRARARTCHGT